jgi:predicted Zn-dependent protease
MRCSRLSNTTLALVLSVSVGAPATAGAEALTVASAEAGYEAAVATAQAGDYAKAAQLFDDLLKRLPTDHALRTLALYGAARSHEEVGTPESACNAIHRFRRLLGRPDIERAKKATAERAIVKLSSACASAPAPAPAAESGDASGVSSEFAIVAICIVAAGMLMTGLVISSQ